MNRPPRADLRPFVLALPDSEAYAPLLNPPHSLSLRSGLVTLQPDQECGEHSTEQHEELIVCLAGTGMIEAAEQQRPLAAGQIAYNPPFTRHNVRNTGTLPMRYIYIVTPVSD
jgi:quercetin dioxygenase-like cupin family protein